MRDSVSMSECVQVHVCVCMYGGKSGGSEFLESIIIICDGREGLSSTVEFLILLYYILLFRAKGRLPS